MCYKRTARRATVAAGAATEKEENERRHRYGFLIMRERAGRNPIGLFVLGLFPTDYSPVQHMHE